MADNRYSLMPIFEWKLELPHLGYPTIRFDYDYGTYDSSIIAIILFPIRLLQPWFFDYGDFLMFFSIQDGMPRYHF